MNFQSLFSATLYCILILFMVSAAGYIIAPSTMLSVVGIQGTQQNSFLVQTLSAALISFIPIVYAVTQNKSTTNYRKYILISISAYMLLSSIVDTYGFVTLVVNSVSIPSIVIRLFLGGIVFLGSRKD